MQEVSEVDIQQLIETLKTVSNYDFSDYSIKSFTRRVEKLTVDHRMDVKQITQRLKTDKDFREQAVKEITVNTTELFRDPKIWHNLRFRVLPKLKDRYSINVWHAGSSTGQEVYSMMILLHEMDMLHKANIYATDINSDVIAKAKEGKYIYRFNLDYLNNFNKVIRQNPFNFDEYKDVPYEKYFEINKIKDYIKMNKFLRDKPVYAKHNLVNEENPFDVKFDIIFCRNVLIYFNYELQNKLFELFYQNLVPKGVLVLGVHESIMGIKASKYAKRGLVYVRK